MKNNEKRILFLIRYTPPLFIIISALFIFLFLQNEHKLENKSNKEFIESQVLETEKKRLSLTINRVDSFLTRKESEARKRLQNILKHNVNIAHRIAMNIYTQFKDSKTKQEIIELIKSALREITFHDKRGYLFIYEMSGKNILNARFPEFENKQFYNYQDANGVFLLKEMSKLLETKDEVFYDWYWYKDEEKKNQYKKVGFFKKFEPFDLFIGAGEYIDEYESIIKEEALAHIRKLHSSQDEYIFVLGKDGKIIANQYLELEGKNIFLYDKLEGLQDVFKEVKKSANGGGQFAFYKLPIASQKKVVEKISYLKHFKRWDWVVGTGFNLNEVNKVIEKRQAQSDAKYQEYFENLLYIAISLVFILLAFSYMMALFLEKTFYQYKQNIEEKTNSLIQAQSIAKMGEWELDIATMTAHWSDSVLKVFGIKNRPKVVGPACLQELMYPDDFPKFEKSMHCCIKEGTEHKVTYRIYTQDTNELKWILCKGKLDKKKNAVVGFIQDISELKRLEEEKLKQEDILYQQSKMAAMGEMLVNIAHQWRQPLSLISTVSSGILLNKKMGTLDENLLESSMINIQNSVKYLSETIDDFRSFFKPDKNKEVFKMREAISKTLSLVAAQYKSKHIEVIQDIDDLEIKSLQNELVQVLINILNNSRDAYKNPLDDKYIFISAKKEDDVIKISIKDNAGGISVKPIEKIFEPYFTTKYKAKGTGIGLYMSKEMIRRHLSGDIVAKNSKYTYNSKEYIGAEFIITLPVLMDK